MIIHNIDRNAAGSISVVFQRVLGAVVIILGLYLVLWGKNQDQPEGIQVVQIDQQMARMNGNTETQNGDSVTNVTSVECV